MLLEKGAGMYGGTWGLRAGTLPSTAVCTHMLMCVEKTGPEVFSESQQNVTFSLHLLIKPNWHCGEGLTSVLQSQVLKAWYPVGGGTFRRWGQVEGNYVSCGRHGLHQTIENPCSPLNPLLPGCHTQAFLLCTQSMLERPRQQSQEITACGREHELKPAFLRSWS